MKGLLCFCGILAVVFPLFNVQKKDIFAMENISNVYFVQWNDGKQEYLRQEKREFSQAELSKNEGVILVVEGSCVDDVCEYLNLKIAKREEVNGREVIFGWTDMYSDFVWMQGKQVNVQLLEDKDKTIVGFPVILSGFWCIKNSYNVKKKSRRKNGNKK